MRTSIERILLVTAVLALAGALASPPRAAAANVSFTLYGDNNNGWGTLPSQLSTPGPALAADLGDNVTLVLSSTDGNQYRWYLDYDNDSTRDGNEPRSPNFRDTPVQWNFTANTPGTFAYRTQSDPAVMWGWFTIRNTTSPPPGPGTPFSLDGSLMIVLGITVGFVALLLVASVYARRKKEQKNPETKE